MSAIADQGLSCDALAASAGGAGNPGCAANSGDLAIRAGPAIPGFPTIRGFLFDLDGTLLLSDRSLGGYELLSGAIEVLSVLNERAIPFAVLTNGSAYPPAEQAARLRGLGLPVASLGATQQIGLEQNSDLAGRGNALSIGWSLQSFPLL